MRKSDDVMGVKARIFFALFMVAWLAQYFVGCTSIRPDGSKARLGDGAITTKFGEIELGDLLDTIQPVLESASQYDPNIALAARLIGSRSTKNEDPKGSTKTARWLYDGAKIDPALLEFDEVWVRKSSGKPAMAVVAPPADTNAINAAVEKIMGSGIVSEVPR